MNKDEYKNWINEAKEDCFFEYCQDVDAQVCAENPCSNDGCDAPSTRYEGWRKNLGTIGFNGRPRFEYHAVSICDKCGDVVLF